MNEALSESGKVSSTRIAMFALLASVLFCIVWCTVYQVTLPKLDAEWVLLVGTAFGAKVWQKKYEAPADAQPK